MSAGELARCCSVDAELRGRKGRMERREMVAAAAAVVGERDMARCRGEARVICEPVASRVARC
jgi:hypothetical protein